MAPKRRSKQVFIFNNHEPPRTFQRARKFLSNKALGWTNAFNWTMTYRLDSDIISHYGILHRRQGEPISRNYKELFSKKTKLAAWIVSHCRTTTKREDYVKELQKYVSVDIFGSCGKLRCGRSEDQACLERINRDYKFYLAFENDLCTDYVTEKFFHYMTADVVIVARASNIPQAPKDIYINTDDFSSPKELARRMKYLSEHPEEYIGILQEKNKYAILYEDYPIRRKDGSIRYMHYHYEAVPFCQVCQRLWNLSKYGKTIPDILKWFDKKSCSPPKDLRH